MSDMSTAHLEKMKSWLTENEKMLEIVNSNDPLRKLFQKNIELYRHLQNNHGMNEFLQKAVNNLNDLTEMQFKDAIIFDRVIKIVLGMMSTSLEISCMNYFLLAKIFMLQLKSNIGLIASQNVVIEYVKIICRHFIWTFKKLHKDFKIKYLKVANLQLKLFVGFQKMFVDDFIGSVYMETIVELHLYSDKENISDNLNELRQKFKNLLWRQENNPKFYTNILMKNQSEQKLQTMYEVCIEIMEEITGDENLLNTALSTDTESNLCYQLLQSASENPHMMHIQPELFDRIILKTMLLLSNDLETLAEKNIRYLEETLIKKMIFGDYWMSLLCFHVWCEFLGQMKSIDTVEEYYIVFQSLLRKIWNPSTDITSRSQFLVSSILQFIFKIYPEVTRSNCVDVDLVFPLMKQAEPKMIKSFDEAFKVCKDDPNVFNYYEMNSSLKVLAMRKNIRTNHETTTNLCELIQFVDDCDWSLHSGIIINIMDIVTVQSDPQSKMMLMLKLNQVLNKERSVPLSVKLKLLDMLFSCISLAQLKLGLPGLLAREVNKLLASSVSNKDLVITRAVLKKFTSSISDPQVLKFTQEIYFESDIAVEQSEVEQLEFLTKSRDFKTIHECAQISHSHEVQANSTSNYSSRLSVILKYSESIQDENLSEPDCNLIRRIITNLNKTVTK